MNRRSSRLKKIVALAEAEERHLAVLTGRAQSKLTQMQDKLGELAAYRQSYLGKSLSRNDCHAAHWQDYQNFLLRLDEALRAQQQVVNDCQQVLDTHRRRWARKRQRVESLERVQERYAREERRRSDRIEQRRQDDRPVNPERYDDSS
ncbi:MAG: flagellar export protein FliJ [Woeseiaceae bacterium]|nr:flagellar export protein FliJ [Woeseiaceae bacterium]